MALTKTLEALNELYSTLRDAGAPVADRLRPGLRAAEVDYLASRLPFSFPEELAVLYQWHNGADGSDDEDLRSAARMLSPDGAFWSMAEIVEGYFECRQTAEEIAWEEQSADFFWSRTTLPLFPTFEGMRDGWVAICDEPTATRYGYLYADNDYYNDIQPSLAQLIQNFTDRWRAGAYVFDDNHIRQTERFAEFYRPEATLLRWSGTQE